ncbi:MAG: hypothetical protein CMJ76_03765 [Planctomycetaceae bacterium]|nr:hypothetical protein [Planctomycetaceae bacterium]
MRSLLSIVSILVMLPSIALAVTTKVGTAKIDITPSHPTLLAGYGGRPGEHVSVDMKLWARALVIGNDTPVLLIAVDNCGVPAKLTKVIQRALSDSLGLSPEQVVISSTHTHNAPSLEGYAPVVWGSRVTPEQQIRSSRYTQWFIEKVIAVAKQAFEHRKEATLHWGQGRVHFGGNRRVLSNGQWTGFGLNPGGPVDHSMPVMVARSNEGTPIAIWSNYACHCTSEGSRNHISGDWAGNANLEIERRFPSAVALTTVGCGADVGPQPSGSFEIAKQHGTTLANEVARLIDSPLTKLKGEPQPSNRQFNLPLAKPQNRAVFVEHSKGTGFHADQARFVLEYEKEHGAIQTDVPYTVTCWKFDQDLAIVFMAGEVVVDYAVRLKTHLDWERLWINGWSNDVPSYIPSRRILNEGGYEPGFSQVYYGLPAPYDPAIEDLIFNEVIGLVGAEFNNPDPDRPAPDFLRQPSAMGQFLKNIESWYAKLNPKLKKGLKPIAYLSKNSHSGFSQLKSVNPARDHWFHYSGLQDQRPFIRQTDKQQTIKWKTSAVSGNSKEIRFVFAGGLGWITQPKTEGFKVLINGQPKLNIDVTLDTTSWESDDTQVKLDYLVTWNSDIDSAGLFYLTVPTALLDNNGQLEIEVRSLGSESLRWFSIDELPQVTKVERAIAEQIRNQ